MAKIRMRFGWPCLSSHAIARVVACVTISCALVTATAAQVLAQNSISINGVSLPTAESVVLHGGVPFVPMRSTFEKLGATVHFVNNTATASMGGHDLLQATLGSSNATIRGVAKQLDAAPFTANGHTYIPLSALASIFGAKFVHGPNGYNITAAVPAVAMPTPAAMAATLPPVQEPVATTGGGIPWWLWLLGLLLLLLLLWWWLSRRAVPSAIGAVGGLGSLGAIVPMLLKYIPGMSSIDRSGFAQSILGAFTKQGYNEQRLQNAGVDAGAARTGDPNALIDLVNHATQNLPGALKDGIMNYARSAPSFLQNMPGPLGSAIKGLLGQ